MRAVVLMKVAPIVPEDRISNDCKSAQRLQMKMSEHFDPRVKMFAHFHLQSLC